METSSNPIIEASLKTFANHLSHALHSFPNFSVIAIDMAGNIIYWDENAYKNFGYLAVEMLERNIHELVGNPLENGILDIKQKSGCLIMTYVTVITHIDLGAIIITQNLHDHLSAKEQLLRTEILTKMAHDLRSPLTGIVGFAQLMHAGAVGDISVQQKEYLGDILNSSKQLLELIQEVNALVKNTSSYSFKPVNINELIQETLGLLRDVTDKKNLQYEVKVDEKMSTITIDKVKFKLLLYAYLSTIGKIMNDGGKIEITVRNEEKDCFSVNIKNTETILQLEASSFEFALIKNLVNAQKGSTELTSAELNIRLPIISIKEA